MVSDEDIEKIINDEKRLIAHVEQLINTGEIEQAKKYMSITSMMSRFGSDGVRTKGCGAGSNMMTINIDGNIYPCHRFVGNEDIQLGNISDGKVRNNDTFYQNVGLSNFSQCKNCVAKYLCGGGCVNENYEYTHNINEAPERRCKYTRAIVEELLHVYLRMSDEAKAKMFKK